MYVLQAFVSCFYNYCLVVWHTIGMKNTNKIEKVQFRVLKYILNDFKYPYSIFGEQSGLPLLYVKRIMVVLIEIYRMYNLLGPMYLHSSLSKQGALV